MTEALRAKIQRLRGPILVLGASGFVGANLLRTLLECRDDVFGTSSTEHPWRLADIASGHLHAVDLLVDAHVKMVLDETRPLTVFDCVAYGAYPFEQDTDRIYRTNVNLKVKLLEELRERHTHVYVHAGSSSEYGKDSAGPAESVKPQPNSHYAASKSAAAGLIHYYGQILGFPAANLRFYSIYGPQEDPARLMPGLIAAGTRGELPEFVSPDISRDFVYIDDACEAFVDTALNLHSELYGQSFNIGTGHCTTIREIAEVARDLFKLDQEPVFSMKARDWDVTNWYADPARAESMLSWSAHTSLHEGLEKTRDWFEGLEDAEQYLCSSKRSLSSRGSISAVIACYKDGRAIPLMYERLKRVFEKLNIDHEIIFVNDGSPDNSEEVIRKISEADRHVIGITHSRNFGSQSAFRSGMEIATKDACVLLDGDLQDPPELIEAFFEQWQAGFDVVYGRRVAREAPWYMQIAYRQFYRIFDRFSYLKIPHDAGDFSLIDRRVMHWLLRMPERDLLLRGLRAFVGFKQTGVDYVRPERMFGKTTNSLLKNIGWAKKGILAFSRTPLNALTAAGVFLLSAVFVLGGLQILAKLAFPSIAPPGVTTLMLIVMGFGAINLFALSLVGEYVAKIFEEVKQRPHFVRRSIIRDGQVRDAS